MTELRDRLQSAISFLNAKLSQRIVYWVFLSIIVIEVLILVPSVLRRERELLGYLRSLSTAQTLGLLEGRDLDLLAGEDLVQQLAAIETSDIVLGGTLYNRQGTAIGSFGEPPELTLQESFQSWRQDRYFRWQDRYDSPWEMAPFQGQYVLIVRHDAAWVRQEFFNFIGRIAGLVVIISIFVTGATLVVLRRLLINPVLQLRQDLLTAGAAIHHDADPGKLAFASLARHRDDELGDVMTAFDQMFRQITDAIATRKQSENRFRLLVEQAVDAFFVINRAGRVIDVNQHACDSLGYSRAELLNLSVSYIQTTLSAEEVNLLWQRLQPGHPQTIEGLHQRRDGSKFPVEVRLGMVDTEPDRCILALARDITERKASEQAMARLAEIGELAAMIVHEVRSPLTTILMGLNSFRSLNLNDRAKVRLELALEESDRLQHLLNEILMYARQPRLDCRSFDLNQLIQDIHLSLQGSAWLDQRQLTVRVPEQPVLLEADRDKLKQVFINLVTNACEASPRGETIVWTVQPPDNQQVTVTVHNGGQPIPADILPKLTQPFFTTKPSGNGLGLAITKRIVEAHQGEFQITSSLQDGTLARVMLPLAFFSRDTLALKEF
jgi:PAS domain S-box-containing protein